jgi:hypothetical protein
MRSALPTAETLRMALSEEGRRMVDCETALSTSNRCYSTVEICGSGVMNAAALDLGFPAITVTI